MPGADPGEGDVALGEQLIHDVYEALHAGPGWPGTLLVVTYDEHGGCYDHVPPLIAPGTVYRVPARGTPGLHLGPEDGRAVLEPVRADRAGRGGTWVRRCVQAQRAPDR
jgi:hypothetical protein